MPDHTTQISPRVESQVGYTGRTILPRAEGPKEVVASTDDISFWDFLDIVNPLQHIPVVSTLYRELTGDEISQGARIAGGGLYGGPVGVMASLINVAIEAETGGDLGANILALVVGEASPGPKPSPVATPADAQYAMIGTVPPDHQFRADGSAAAEPWDEPLWGSAGGGAVNVAPSAPVQTLIQAPAADTAASISGAHPATGSGLAALAALVNKKSVAETASTVTKISGPSVTTHERDPESPTPSAPGALMSAQNTAQAAAVETAAQTAQLRRKSSAPANPAAAQQATVTAIPATIAIPAPDLPTAGFKLMPGENLSKARFREMHIEKRAAAVSIRKAQITADRQERFEAGQQAGQTRLRDIARPPMSGGAQVHAPFQFNQDLSAHQPSARRNRITTSADAETLARTQRIAEEVRLVEAEAVSATDFYQTMMENLAKYHSQKDAR